MAKVTVYIPTHNYGQYLEQAIQSVLKQNMDDWELIIIDDGSTDNTPAILERYEAHPQIRIFEQHNKGLNVTSNIALRLSSGEYIIRLDADDLFDENILLVLSRVLDIKPDIDLVYPDYYLIDTDGEVLEIVRKRKVDDDGALRDIPAHGAGTMVRKRCLLELSGYEEQFRCQDGYDLWLKFVQRYKPYNVNVPLFYYRQHAKSLTQEKQKILSTRQHIKKNFVDKYQDGKRPKVWGIIPVVLHSAYPHSDPFRILGGKPLLWYTLTEAEQATTLDRIILTTDHNDISEYAASFDRIETIKRPKNLARATARTADIVQHVLSVMNAGKKPDAVCVLYTSTPLRKAYHIDKAVDTFAIFDVDSVIAIAEDLSFYYFHERNGLTPVSKSERNIRAERDALYRENGALYLSHTDVIATGKMIGTRIGHITMLPHESIKINSAYDFWLAEKILTEWLPVEASPLIEPTPKDTI